MNGWNNIQKTAFACWLGGAVAILLCVGVILSGFTNIVPEWKTPLAGVFFGVTFLAVGGTLWQIGTGRRFR